MDFETKRKPRFGLILIIIVLIGWNGYLSYKVYQLESQSPTATNTIVNKSVSQITNTFVEVVEKTRDKVVVVYNYKGNTLYGSGSGVVYQNNQRELMIVTNHHVVNGAQTIKVKFANSEIFEASLIGSDEYTDIALLKVSVDFDIEAFDLGDSTLTSVGEQVLAIGSPLGEEFQGTVTSGIISGKDRTVPMDLNGDGVSDWDAVVLQTNAAINPGNSGGALVNLQGELIGIPSSKIQYNQGTSVEGMGFAIPINEVIPIATQLIEKGKVTRPKLGISATEIDNLSTLQKRSNNISNDQKGLFIVSVESGSPADIGGLKNNDILIEFDGKEVTSFKEFRKSLYQKHLGDTVKAVVLRNGEQVAVEVTLS